jgi:hypothetical protein
VISLPVLPPLEPITRYWPENGVIWPGVNRSALIDATFSGVCGFDGLLRLCTTPASENVVCIYMHKDDVGIKAHGEGQLNAVASVSRAQLQRRVHQVTHQAEFVRYRKSCGPSGTDGDSDHDA